MLVVDLAELGAPVADHAVRRLAAAHLSQEDRGLGCLALGEEDPVVPIRIGPVLQQLAADRRDPVVPPVAPDRDLAAQLVDQGVLDDLLVGEGEHLLDTLVGALRATLAYRCDRDVGLARPA